MITSNVFQSRGPVHLRFSFQHNVTCSATGKISSVPFHVSFNKKLDVHPHINAASNSSDSLVILDPSPENGYGENQNVQFTKYGYPIRSPSDTYVVPYSATVSRIIPQEQQFESLVAGYCKTCTSKTDISDVQMVVLRFFCINTIEIYVKKTVYIEDEIFIPKEEFAAMGMSYCTNNPDEIPKQILFGHYGECIGSTTRTINAQIMVPYGFKYQKGRASSEISETESTLPCLDGHDSIALKDGNAAKDSIFGERQSMVDTILAMDDAERDLYLQYLGSHAQIENITEKVCGEHANQSGFILS